METATLALNFARRCAATAERGDSTFNAIVLGRYKVGDWPKCEMGAKWE